MADEVWLTATGRARVQAELEHLITVERPAMGTRLRDARADGGEPGENLALTAAQDEQAQLEARIARLEDRLRRATTIVPVTDGSVSLGSTVLVADQTNNTERWYTLVGVDEAAPSEGKISDRSPLGQALLGAHVGDTCMLHSPRGERAVIVLEIKASV
jgi:transcription elongation factor GreA